MPVYIVSYDLTRPGQKYPELWEALEALCGLAPIAAHLAGQGRGGDLPGNPEAGH